MARHIPALYLPPILLNKVQLPLTDLLTLLNIHPPPHGQLRRL